MKTPWQPAAKYNGITQINITFIPIRLRPEAGRFVQSFAILYPVILIQIGEGFFFLIIFFLLKQLMNLQFPPPCSPTNCPISLKSLLFKENLSEL